MSISINGTNGLTFNDASTQNTAATGFGFKNRIINGAMVIDQRNAGAVVTGDAYITDRWRTYHGQTYDIQQSTDAPTGFRNSIKVTKTSSIQSTYGYLVQYLEGFNTYDLMFGSASASTVTLSFWVKSSVVGAFTCGVGNSTVSTRFYPASYTVIAANTWEYKSVVISGDTSGTWAGATNGAGACVYFNYGASGVATVNSWNNGDVQVASAASANLGTTSGATFYITGVQLEKGSTATSFDYRPYGTELALCQRYCLYEPFFQVPPVTSLVNVNYALKATMRAAPTATFTTNNSTPSIGAASISNVLIGGAGGSTGVASNCTALFVAEL